MHKFLRVVALAIGFLFIIGKDTWNHLQNPSWMYWSFLLGKALPIWILLIITLYQTFTHRIYYQTDSSHKLLSIQFQPSPSHPHSAIPFLKISIFICIALLFSSVGDIYLHLNFLYHKEFYFIYGVAGFLTAHLFYIIAFSAVPYFDSNDGKWKTKMEWISSWKDLIWIFPFLLYLCIVFYFVLPNLKPSLVAPVLIYASVISSFGIKIVSRYGKPSFYIKEKNQSFTTAVDTSLSSIRSWQWSRIIGGIVFMISDTMIALTSFKVITTLSNFQTTLIIMTTYYVAQHWISNSIHEYVTALQQYKVKE